MRPKSFLVILEDDYDRFDPDAATSIKRSLMMTKGVATVMDGEKEEAATPALNPHHVQATAGRESVGTVERPQMKGMMLYHWRAPGLVNWDLIDDEETDQAELQTAVVELDAKFREASDWMFSELGRRRKPHEAANAAYRRIEPILAKWAKLGGQDTEPETNARLALRELATQHAATQRTRRKTDRN